MNFLNKFNQSFGFTQTESRVVLFLILAFLAGIGIKTFKGNSGTIKKFNYASLDSEFEARSRSIQQSDSAYVNVYETDKESDKTSLKHSAADKQIDHDAKIDLNKATNEELIKLPGIGKAMAERIIKYREENGAFTMIEELMKVKGIGKKKFEKLAPYIIAGK